MPKCLPAPPIADDSQFFTVVNPYPDQPHQGIEDSKAFARWIACIVGEENLLAFYHKPKSANAVIVEVIKDAADFRRLLGAHRWAEILKAPDDQDHLGEEESSIFPCTLTTERAVRNAGWRRCDVKSSWFSKWSPAAADGAIVYPYPIPHFCRPPAEDPMRERLCRPLRMPLFLQPADSDVDGNPQPLAQNTRPPLASTPHLSRSTYTYTRTQQTPTCTVSSDSSDVSTDADVTKTLTPPYVPPNPARAQFVPAIHGSDAPKSAAILPGTVPTPPGPASTSLWAAAETEETETDAREGGALCAAHGVLCSSGICKVRGQLKREGERERRRREREEERGAWAKRTGKQRAHGERVKPGLGLGLGFGRPQAGTVRGRETDVSGRRQQQQQQQPRAPVRPPPAHLLKSTLPRAAAAPEPACEEGGGGMEDRRSRLRPDIEVATTGKRSDSPSHAYGTDASRLRNTTNVIQNPAERTREEGYGKTEDRRARLRPDIKVISTKGESHSYGSLRAHIPWLECVEPFKVCNIDHGDCEDAVSIVSDYTDEPF